MTSALIGVAALLLGASAGWWRAARRTHRVLAASSSAALLQSSLLQAVVDRVTEAVVVYDSSGEVILRNDLAAQERAGRNRTDHDEAACGEACGWIHGDTTPAVPSGRRRALPQGRNLVVTRRGSATRHLELNVWTYGPEDEPRTLAVTRDLSLVRRLEQDAAAVVHELNRLGSALQALHARPDTREAICEAARAVAGAVHTILLETDDAGDLCVRAQGGPPVRPFSMPAVPGSHAHLCQRSGAFTLSSCDRSAGSGDEVWLRALQAAGAPAVAALTFFPLGPPGQPLAVLGIALPTALTSDDARRLALLDIVAQDAGVALERQRLLEQLTAQARTDPLTGLPNRRFWDEELYREMTRGRRLDIPLTVAVLDLDHFKAYNDTHGHAGGDDLLQQVARTWTSMLRGTDVLARLGGEEFGLLLPGCDTPAALLVLNELLAAVPGGMTASAGIARWQGEPGADLVAAADAAMYQAKRAGRNRVTVAQAIPPQAPAPRTRVAAPRGGSPTEQPWIRLVATAPRSIDQPEKQTPAARQRPNSAEPTPGP